eukprot:Blabericola_migrator_1__3623@NODE_2081_length_3301_cov_530_573593_g1319_i0_p1_GENE_NODE_2081_length_3301_cov_530_573593_g1319_i0NODE_2081_length_3301_cov_530_573593_g1319_i0_p1_ORF_typecomplete_len454_score105_57Glnsynt_C/PF00120_24/2_8e92Glnsynt_N_2/PF16952_5/1_7e11_NODE_2081_length_3301_cov_530_573593_g1319_i018563217
MVAPYRFQDLKTDVATGAIDTVLVCHVDMQGRLLGKRFQADFFIDHAYKETQGTNYMLSTDLEMTVVPGYETSNWQKGFGNYTLKPDLTTLRRVPWLQRTALVLCDVLQDGKENVISPRTLLKNQLAKLNALGLNAMMATELEFQLFDQTYEKAHALHYKDLKPTGYYNEYFSIFQTSKDEDVMQAIRNGLHRAGIPVECTEGEANPGQQEINIHYDDALTVADRHCIVKNACKEIAFSKGKAVSFLAKWKSDAFGSSCHIHQSLRDKDGRPAFYDPNGSYGMSHTMRHYLAGQLRHTGDITYFLAPYINSYKRFATSSFAPTKVTWSVDNRSAAYRVCDPGTESVRIECRVGGADLNPYLAMAGLIAAGIDGIEKKLELGPCSVGNAYMREDLVEVPRTLRDATQLLDKSMFLRQALGETVINHYARAARWEQETFDQAVTDWEVARGFERA